MNILQKRKMRRRHNNNYNTRKRRLRMLKSVHIRGCKHKRKKHIKRNKGVVRLIQSNESSKETLNPNSTEIITFTVKQYKYYDDLNLNSSPKPLKHPFTAKSQCSIFNQSLKTFSKTPILKNWQSITTNETMIQSLIGNNENNSLTQSSEKANYSCLALSTIIQSSLDKSDPHADKYYNQTASESGSDSQREYLKMHPDGLLLDENPDCKITFNQTFNRTISKISSSGDDSDSDNECLKFHPNRRLQVEQTNCTILNGSFELQESNKLRDQQTNEKAKTDSLPQTHCPLVDVKKSYKVSEMWLDILNTPDLWKTETLVSSDLCHTTLNLYSTSNKVDDENRLDFEEMIEDIKELKSISNLYEDRFQEKLTDPDFKTLLADFYITPAKVEILYNKLTLDMSQQECLAQLCTEMQWTQPTYTSVDFKNSGSVLFSCNLKSKSFLPKRPGLSGNLNKELAAYECLNWLGFEQKREGNANWPSKNRSIL